MYLRLLAGLSGNFFTGLCSRSASFSPSIRRALALLIALLSIVSTSAQADTIWSFVPCPHWSYGNVAEPSEAAWRDSAHQWGASCVSAASCGGGGLLPLDISCSVTLKPTLPCGGGGTVYPVVHGTAANGNSPVIHPDSRGVWHCALSWLDTQDDKNKTQGDSDCKGNCKGNPINIGNANKYQKEVDIAAASDGGVEFYRYYNSYAPVPDHRIGINWTHNYYRNVYSLPNDVSYVLRPDGKTLVFRWVASAWVPDSDTPERLEAAGSGWKFTSKDDDVEVYDSNGRLTTITDRLGRVTTLLYSDGTSSSGPTGGVFEGTTKTLHAGYLLSATDFRGRALQFTYNSNTNVSKIADSAGNIYQFQYDSAGNLWKVIYPGTGSPTRTYVYNESANTSSADLPYALTGITDENGARFATFQYLADGRAKTTTYASGANNYSMTYGTGTVTWTDPLGTSRTSTLSRIQGVSVVTGTTQTCTGCGGTTTESFEYDANRNQTSHKDFNGNLSCFAFDARRLETARTEGLSGSGTCASRVTTPATRTITTEWQPVQRLVKRKAEPLRITTLAYNGDPGVSCAPTGASTELVCSRTVQATTDSDGHLAFTATSDGAARVWAYTYNVNGQVLTVDGPRTDVSDVTTYAYYSTNDPSGNYKAGDLASVTNALSQVTQFTQYDGMGRLKKSIDPNGLETILAYAPRGWLTSRQVGTTSSGYETTAYEYDGLGQLKKVTLPDASYVSYTYDDAHRLTQIQDGLGNKIVYTLDAMGNRTAENAYDVNAVLVRTHTRVMDALNRLKQDIGGTNPTTQITQNGYDGNDNLTTITDPLSRVTTQIYDARNRLTEVRDPFNGSSAPTKYEYNGLDQLTKVTDPANLATTYALNGHGELLTQVSPDTGTTVFTYDPASNLSSKLDARSISASYVYDALNRLTQITYPDETVIYTFDSCTNGVGRLCSIADNSGTSSYAFDVKGRITSKTQTVGSITRTMAYAYNAAGQLSTLTTPSGKAVLYTYSNNRPVSVTVDGTPVLSSVFYEPFGPNGGWVWGNSTVSAPNTHTRLFDKDFRAKRITSDLPASGSQPYFDRQIGWDDQGRVGSMTDLANSALNATYGYDALDRLTSASQGSSSWGYTYSGVGDRLTSTISSSTTNYSYTSGTHRLQSLSGAQSKSYTVDAAGNMTSDGTSTWTYGGNNRPTQVGSTSFLINALGQRVKKATTSAATLFVYDEAGRLWGEYDGTGSLIEETIWLDDLPVAVIKSGPSYVHPDHLGTPRLVTRPSDNAILWRWDNTEAFGNSQPNDNPSGLGTFAYNLRFPGQYFDAETGTHYNYFRDYDPAIGRYIESDPIGLAGGLNTFSYVLGSPLRYRDPKGREYAQMPGPSDIAHCLLNPSDCWNASPWECKAKAVQATREEFGHSGDHDDSGAFRHCMWSCCMAKQGGTDAAKGIGDAHENFAANPRCFQNMDLFNNAMGLSLASIGGDCRSGCKQLPLQKRPKGTCEKCGGSNYY